jgi:alkane 1-monooxygenase
MSTRYKTGQNNNKHPMIQSVARASLRSRPQFTEWATIRRVGEHLLCFFLPLTNLAFLACGPQSGYLSLLWTAPVWLCIVADAFSPTEVKREPIPAEPWPFQLSLYLLFVLQLLNILLMLRLAAGLSWDNPQHIADAVAAVIAMRIMTGTTSCCSGIAVAHELIHGSRRHQRWMGRVLLWTVLYDHFAVEHIRGHHRLASTSGDCATARFGESFASFWRRGPLSQYRNAWKLENQRLARMPAGLRWLRHRVLWGQMGQALLLLSILCLFGPVALLMFAYQAVAAVRLLETVNYIQHWGLTRSEGHFGARDAWSTDSWFTLHSFVGLARHADHHQSAATPYHRLRDNEGSPSMPCGYFGMAMLVRCFDSRYRAYATEELRARRLGPFRPGNPE